MGANNYGNANITFRYKHPAKAENFNSVLRGVCPSGIYKGGTVSYIGNILTLAPYTAIFESSNDKSTTITTISAIDLSTVTTFGGNASSATPYVIMRYSYSNIISNYPDYYQVAIGDIQTTDIIICKVLFDDGGVVNGIDYSEAHTAPQYNKDLNTFNIACDTYIKGNKINKEVTTAIDINTVTDELICDTSLFFSPTADRTADITAGAERQGTVISMYNSGTFNTTITYYSTNTFTILINEYVKFKWNGVRWIIVESNSQEFLGWEECFYSLSRTTEIDGTNHIYELTVTGDKTAYFKAGQKIKFTQDASVKYAIITYVETSGGNTILTVYGGTDYAISANAITIARLAKVNRPYDFDGSPIKWTISYSQTEFTQTNNASGTWYYTNNTFFLEKGVWELKLNNIVLFGNVQTSNFVNNLKLSLSTASNSESNSEYRTNSSGGVYIETLKISESLTKSKTQRLQLYVIIRNDEGSVSGRFINYGFVTTAGDTNPKTITMTPSCL